MIIDCFPFFNELDLLEIRLNELSNVVDHFVLVEANKTQSLKDKPFYFDENKERFKPFLDKIIHIKLSECPSNDRNLWTMENFQRNSVMLGLKQLNISSSDKIMISDMDEIPRAEAILNSINNPDFKNLPAYTLDIDFYVYFMNLKAVNKIWNGTAIFNPGLLNEYSIQNIKDGKSIYPKYANGGWHFSWLGGYKSIRQKALSCIEPYDKSQVPSEETFKIYFEEYLKNPSKKFIHIENLNMQGIDLEIMSEFSSYPTYLLNNFDKYKNYFLLS
jgi:beta-1,4-mannosyl-glycoprotein beta-1,4-N-acetylglucosaminyltransferase